MPRIEIQEEMLPKVPLGYDTCLQVSESSLTKPGLARRLCSNLHICCEQREYGTSNGTDKSIDRNCGIRVKSVAIDYVVL